MDGRQRLQAVNTGIDTLLDANRRPKRGFFEKSSSRSGQQGRSGQQSLIRAPSAAAAASRKRRAPSTSKQRCRHARGQPMLPDVGQDCAWTITSAS